MNIFQRNARKIVVLAVIAGSTSGIFARVITASSLAIGFYRLTFALPFFLIPVLLKHRQELLQVPKKELVWSILSGFFLFGHFFSWFTAVDNTTIASAVVLAALHPLVVLVVTILVFKQKVGYKAVLGILAALIGGMIITGTDYSFAGSNIFGDILAFMAAVCMGIYFCIGRSVRTKISSGIYVFIVFASCWVWFTLGMIITKTPFTGYPTSDYLWLIVMTALCQLGAHAVMNWSFGYVSALYVSTWETGETIFATVMAAILFSEIPTVWQWIGGLIVIAGLLYYNFHEGDAEKKEEVTDGI